VGPRRVLRQPRSTRAEAAAVEVAAALPELRHEELWPVDPTLLAVPQLIIRGHRLAVEHVLDMLAVGDDIDTIVEGYAWMEREDVLGCIEYARRLVGHERIEPLVIEPRTA